VSGERYNFPDFFRGEVPGPPGGYYYSGDLIDNYQGSVAFFQGIQDRARDLGAEPSWNPLAGRDNAIAGTPYIPADIQPVAQEDKAAYLMVNFGSDDLGGGVRLSGNIGVRYVHTNIRSEGSLGVPSAGSLNIADPFDVRCEATIPPGAPPGTPPQSPGGVCLLGPAGYAELQTFAGDGATVSDVAEHSYDYWLPSLNIRLGLSDDVIMRFAASKVL